MNTNIDSLQTSVLIVTNFYTSIFGGPLSQLLKCLTAAKIGVGLKKSGVAAVPVCIVHRYAPSGFIPYEINLIDKHSGLHCLTLAGMDENTQEIIVGGKSIELLFGEINNIFPDGDGESLSVMKDTFIPGANYVSSCMRWLEYLLKDFSVLVVEHNDFVPEYLRHGRMFPITAFVADSAEIMEGRNALLPWERDDNPRPPVIPCPDVTIANARSLKTLKHYDLDFDQLFDGRERVMDYLYGAMESDVPDHMRKLRDDTRVALEELYGVQNAAPGARCDRSFRICKTRAAKIIYQLEKIRRHSSAALAVSKATAEKRIRNACDFLSPLGRRQMDVLGGAQIPLSYGRAGLRTIYERLDISDRNHQLIEID